MTKVLRLKKVPEKIWDIVEFAEENGVDIVYARNNLEYSVDMFIRINSLEKDALLTYDHISEIDSIHIHQHVKPLKDRNTLSLVKPEFDKVDIEAIREMGQKISFMYTDQKKWRVYHLVRFENDGEIFALNPNMSDPVYLGLVYLMRIAESLTGMDFENRVEVTDVYPSKRKPSNPNLIN